MEICDYNICTGCSVCALRCPQKCINMEYDKEGFLFPKIDQDRCINCSLCIEICPANKGYISENMLSYPHVYALRSKDKALLAKSSSGGMFGILARYVISMNGVVFGCAFNEKFNPIHIAVEDEAALALLHGSKYVQSDTLSTYFEAEEALKNNRWVLYTGTPCQIAGLKAYLKKNYEKLINVDLICHGVPSNQLFHDYLGELEQQLGGEIIKYNFRDKSKYGWGCFGTLVYEKDGVIKRKSFWPEIDYFYHHYLKGNIYRESCYSCKYAAIPRTGDFTIGDYWSIEKFHKEFYPPDGVSLVLINTEKAEVVFNKIENALDVISSKIEYAIYNNGNLQKPTARPKARDTFYKEVNQYGFLYVAKKGVKLKRVTPFIKRKMPYQLKLKIKALLSISK